MRLGRDAEAAEHAALRVEQRRCDAEDARPEFADCHAMPGVADRAQRCAECIPIRAEAGGGDRRAVAGEQRAQLMRRQMREDHLRGRAGEQRPALAAAEQPGRCARGRHVVDAHHRAAEQQAQQRAVPGVLRQASHRRPAADRHRIAQPHGAVELDDARAEHPGAARNRRQQPGLLQHLDVAVAGRARGAGKADQVLGRPGRRRGGEHVEQPEHLLEAAGAARL